MIAILNIAVSPLGRLALGIGGVLLIWNLFASRQQAIGARDAVAKIERADDATASAIRDADARSRRGTSSGGLLGNSVRDPNAVSE
ncbi:MAG: hypothetical protein NW200_07420 [Hyphomonadaceae bacterium]|nr:hypothetical protein [Hyphomonadaceae bacterium]